ncbi:MAG: hypothetical protein ACLP9L_08980 [Thermoguttaceae bacterium]
MAKFTGVQIILLYLKTRAKGTDPGLSCQSLLAEKSADSADGYIDSGDAATRTAGVGSAKNSYGENFSTECGDLPLTADAASCI